MDDRGILRVSVQCTYTSAENTLGEQTDYEIRQHSKLSNVALTTGMDKGVRMEKLNFDWASEIFFVEQMGLA